MYDEKLSICIKPSGNLLYDIENYCTLYNIPIEHFIDIICDQKVTPMIRGKASEFTVYDCLKEILDSSIWDIRKENLNAQPNSPDEDVSIVHLSTSVKINIEVKTAVRGSFSMSARKITVPHYKVKCHRSRSNLNTVTNDRYLIDDFDLVVCNPSNALIDSGENFMMKSDPTIINYLKKYYNTNDLLGVFTCASRDWRFARSSSICEEYKGYNVIPRTPYVKYFNDENWINLSLIEASLLNIVTEKLNKTQD